MSMDSKKFLMGGLAALAAAAILAAPRLSAAKAVKAAVGSPAPDFTLTDSNGQTRKLSDYTGKNQVVVLEWMNYDCPYVKKQYKTKSMQTLQQDAAAKGVVWLSIISSAEGKQGHYEPAEVNKLNQERDGHAAAILLDYKGKVGKLYGAKTTPHMFVIDGKGVLQYAGAIDDTPSTDAEDVPKRNYVKEAVDAILANKPVATSYTKSYGCSVKY
jgi:peroxiredoxin